jgi:hypothetical protein
VFFVKSHVPSPTVKVLDEYELEPGGERASAGAMAAVGCPIQAKPEAKNAMNSRRQKCSVSGNQNRWNVVVLRQSADSR